MATTTTIDFRTLTVPERFELIEEIWESIIADGWRPMLSEEIKAELDRRIAEHRANLDAAIPWEEVRRAAREKR